MSVFGVTGPNRSEESTVRSLSMNLPELLMAMALDDRSLVCIAEFPRGRHIQFRVGSGVTTTEVVSNRFLNDDNALSNEDEQHLGSLGFDEPSTSHYPNWRSEVFGTEDIAEIVRIATSAITFALHATSNGPVSIRTFEIPS